MPRITALNPRRRGSGAMVYLDGSFGFALRAETVARHHLRVGLDLSDEQVRELQTEDERSSISESTWRLLSYRARSRQELRQRLLRKGHAAAAVDAELERLAGLGYLDDEAFAVALVQARQTGAGARGAAALRFELRRKGIAPDVAATALAGADELEAAHRAAAKRSRSLAQLERSDFSHRLLGFLQRRGFGYDVARRAVETVWRERNGEPLEDPELP